MLFEDYRTMKLLSLIACLLISFSLLGQELGEDSFNIPREDREETESDFEIFAEAGTTESLSYGHFQAKPYLLPRNLKFEKDDAPQLNMLALGRKKEQRKHARMQDATVPERQLQQIKSTTQIFKDNQKDFRFGGNNNIRFSEKNQQNTLENRVRRNIYQPQTPYYNLYNRPYYRRPNRRGFYFHRR